MSSQFEQIRLLTGDDVRLVERLVRTSEYIYQRFTLEELPLILKHYPSIGIFHDSSMYGFLLSQIMTPPHAWIGGFGVSWTESNAYLDILFTLLEHLYPALITRGVRYLHYSGNNADRDWLRNNLLIHGFIPYRLLYSYDKFGYGIPTSGNQEVTIRPVRFSRTGGDMKALLAIEDACFDDLWRYDPTAFNDIAATHPYFVVAELQRKVIGYQFNTVDEENGYLVRIAVHPSVGNKGIGARLMAEAIHFFEQAGTPHILLNTEETNTHAHRLYEWFGFVRLQQTGFVLRKYL
ncbi:MAG TPA: GNAT family N-acetyltransferase [Ktedonobacteraceae bacterium]|nr:GNAT family N-acetyltransferase [Ktedonobacteraceae bacterium]